MVVSLQDPYICAVEKDGEHEFIVKQGLYIWGRVRLHDNYVYLIEKDVNIYSLSRKILTTIALV